MSNTKDVVATTSNAPIGHNSVAELTEIDAVSKSLGKKYLRTNEKGSRERGAFIQYLKQDTEDRPRIPSTHLISPNKATNPNWKDSTATPEFYESMLDIAREGKFSAKEAKILKMKSKDVVKHIHGSPWDAWWKENNKTANSIVGGWKRSLEKLEQAEAKQKLIDAEIALAEKEGRDPELEQFSDKKGADENRTKTIGQKFQAHLENALKSLTTWRNMDNAPEDILSSHEQYAKTIKAMMAVAKKADGIRH